MKAYTNLEQSKKLADILPLESADMYYHYNVGINSYYEDVPRVIQVNNHFVFFHQDVPCWGLAALLNILHFRQNDITSLSGGGYKDGNYISDWCLDYEYDNGDYQKTFGSNPVDACYEMILRLHELNLL